MTHRADALPLHQPAAPPRHAPPSARYRPGHPPQTQKAQPRGLG